MTQAQELATWLRMVADQGDMGRKPCKDDKKRIAADLLESQVDEIARLREAVSESARTLLALYKLEAKIDQALKGEATS